MHETMTGWRRALFVLYTQTMPLHAWMLSSRVRKYYDRLNESQWFSPSLIRMMQAVKLRALLNHAVAHTPYYSDLIPPAGRNPDVFAILLALPLLDKATVRRELPRMMSDNHDPKKILKITTSGSTGEPFVMYADQHQLEMRWAANLRGIEWTGYRFGDKQARLWHQTIGMTKSQVIREKIDALFNRRLFIPAYEMTDANLPATIQKLAKFNPALIDGYAESFNFLARHCNLSKIGRFNTKGIISSAQVLPPSSRVVIEKAFGCPVFDKYGAREFSGIAYEDEDHNGHLVTAENYIVEILRNGVPAKPGELGEVVITDLNNYCMPLIRYRIGDMAVAMSNNTAPSSGRGLPRIGRIEIRAQSIIKGTNGRYLPGTFFMHYFKDFESNIRQFQIVQEREGELIFNIVTTPGTDSRRISEILAGLMPYIGNEMEIYVQDVDSIPLGRTGKHAAVISRLNFDVQNVEIHQCVPNQTS